MKSINQIFKNNPQLINDNEVMELIEYCRELESEIIDKNQVKNFSFEDKLSDIVRDLYNSIKEVEKEDEDSIRFGEIERVDYELAIKNLKKYIEDFSKKNKFRL